MGLLDRFLHIIFEKPLFNSDKADAVNYSNLCYMSISLTILAPFVFVFSLVVCAVLRCLFPAMPPAPATFPLVILLWASIFLFAWFRMYRRAKKWGEPRLSTKPFLAFQLTSAVVILLIDCLLGGDRGPVTHATEIIIFIDSLYVLAFLTYLSRAMALKQRVSSWTYSGFVLGCLVAYSSQLVKVFSTYVKVFST